VPDAADSAAAGPETAGPETAGPQTAAPGTGGRSAPLTRVRHSGPDAADLAAIAVGGGLGSVARYLISQAFPAGHGFPWAIFAINVSGSFALGLLLIYLLQVWPPRRLLRPFLAIGVLGGYTTFSTYAAGVVTLINDHALARADAYALTSVVAGLVAAWCGVTAARRMSGQPRRRPSGGRGGPSADGRAPGDAGRGDADPGLADPDRMEMDS
jgi:CrcB protein